MSTEAEKFQTRKRRRTSGGGGSSRVYLFLFVVVGIDVNKRRSGNFTHVVVFLLNFLSANTNCCVWRRRLSPMIKIENIN